MTNRVNVSKEIESQVLINCRRRCCICFGVNRDVDVKKGQIAHLDKNRNNNNIDNLSYLCLEHHDIYDSKNSQSKNFSLKEVKVYRKELEQVILNAFNKTVKIGKVDGDFSIKKRFLWQTENSSAEIEIHFLDKHNIKINGVALYGLLNLISPNIGEIDFYSYLYEEENNVFYTKFVDSDFSNSNFLILNFKINELKLEITETYFPDFYPFFGRNVSFAGVYSLVEDI